MSQVRGVLSPLEKKDKPAGIVLDFSSLGGPTPRANAQRVRHAGFPRACMGGKEANAWFNYTDEVHREFGTPGHS